MGDSISRQAAIDAFDCSIGGVPADSVKYVVDYAHKMKYKIKNLPSTEPELKWIPCSERLPEDEWVLISKKPTKLSGSKWCVNIAIRMADPRSGKIQWRDTGFGIIPDDKVVAWMPRPEPYQEGKE